VNGFPEALVRLFPTGFRVQFGEDICEQVQRDATRARAQGRLASLVFYLATIFDLIRSAAAERRNPTWNGVRLPSPQRPERGTMLTGWMKDIRHAVFALRRAPGFTAITIATLGIAIGANVGIFSVVDAVLLNPLPYPNADRLVHIAASAPGSDFPEEFGVSSEFYVQYSERSQLLESVSTYNSFTNTLQLDDRIERVRMSWPTHTFFSTMQAAPLLGRLPVAEDESRVAVISHATWLDWFNADPDVIGRTVYISGQDRTVIGVMGPDFWFPSEDTLLWLSNVIEPEGLTPGRFGSSLVGRVAPGVSNEDLARELNALALELPERFGGSTGYASLIEQHRAVITPLRAQLLGVVSGPLWILLGAVVIVLLIACGNVANLFTVRAEHRQRDMAVRRALGAGRGTLVRSQMAEALVIAAGGGVVAVLLALMWVPAFVRAIPPGVPRAAQAGLNPTALLFTAGAAVFAALACGLLPALRSSAPRLTRLHESGRGSTRTRHWGRDALVVGQTALALVLLIGSGLLLRSFWELRQVDPGYSIENIFTFQIAPDEDHLVDPPSFAQFHLDFADRIAAMPGVESVGLVENVPLNEGTAGGRFFTKATAGTEDGALLRFTYTAGNYFDTMSISVLQGRALTNSDHFSTLGNVVISKTAADMLWPGEDPIGRQLQAAGTDTWETVVGVVEDVMQNSFRDAPEPLVYFPFVGQTPETSRNMGSPGYVVRTARTDTIGDEIRAAVREVAPTAPMYRVYTMEGLASSSMFNLSFTMMTLGVSASLALLLGALGLFGVLSYVVAQRTREIGVRMALGAEAAQVRRLVVLQGSRLLALGVVIGLVAAAGSTQVLGSLLFGVQSADLATFVGMSVAMALIGLLASYLPARRASSVDPIESLRND
jgi:predicted permease